MHGGPSLRRGDTNEGLNIPSGIGCLGNNIGWLVTWEFPLRTDSASWKSLESFIQFTSFFNSCNLPDNSIIVFWSLMRFCLASVSKVELWNFRNSSISAKLYWWTSRKSFCWRHNSYRLPCSIRRDRQWRLTEKHTFRTAVIGVFSVCFVEQLAERSVIYVLVWWRSNVGEGTLGVDKLVGDRVLGLITYEGGVDVVGVVTPLVRAGAQVVFHGVQIVEVWKNRSK